METRTGYYVSGAAVEKHLEGLYAKDGVSRVQGLPCRAIELDGTLYKCADSQDAEDRLRAKLAKVPGRRNSNAVAGCKAPSVPRAKWDRDLFDLFVADGEILNALNLARVWRREVVWRRLRSGNVVPLLRAEQVAGRVWLGWEPPDHKNRHGKPTHPGGWLVMDAYTGYIVGVKQERTRAGALAAWEKFSRENAHNVLCKLAEYPDDMRWRFMLQAVRQAVGARGR